MQGSKKSTNFYNDVNKVSKVLSKVVLMRRLQERTTFAEKPLKRKGANSHPNNGSNPSSSRQVVPYTLICRKISGYFLPTAADVKGYSVYFLR